MGRNSVDGCNFRLLELPGGDELRILWRDGDGLALVGREHLDPDGTKECVPVDSGIAVAPEGAANHEVMQEAEAVKIRIRSGEDGAAMVRTDLLPARCGLVVEVDGKRPHRFGENPHACPHRRNRQRLFLGDELLSGVVRHGVGEKRLIHNVLELAG